jgi:uncharacterized protein
MPNTYTAPGVYIEEQVATGPIQGVSTSTAAFIGVINNPEIEPNKPTLITSFNEFKQKFDAKPRDGFYLWYAVRGFFENGGKLAYIVRASSGRHASLELNDSRAAGSQPTLIVKARKVGVPDPAVQVTVANSSLVTVDVFKYSAPVAEADKDSDRIKIGPVEGTLALTGAEAAAKFRPGDRIFIEKGSDNESTTIREVDGEFLSLTKSLGNNYLGGNVRLANLAIGNTSLRVESAASNLGAGNVVIISQTTSSTTVSESAVVKSNQVERINSNLTTYRVELENGLTNDYDRSDSAPAIRVYSQEFTLTVRSPDGKLETRINLSMAVSHPRYFATVLAQEPFALVTVERPQIPSNAPIAQQRPNQINAQPLVGGAADTSPPKLTDYQSALDTLETVDEVNFIAIPDTQDADVQLALLTHCNEKMKDRVAIFDPPATGGFNGAKNRVDLLRSELGFSAIYYPWIKVPHPENDKQLVVIPPSGHIAGIYARSDTQRGVHKAPANEMIAGAMGLVDQLTDSKLGILNDQGINVIRTFPNQTRPTVWGARTTAPKDATAWRYINVRRLMLYIEESIEEGIRWAVFEPNNLALWKKLDRKISEFLNRVWRDGALFGATPEEAFYVKCDEELNPESVRALGQVIVEVGVAPVRPAEFVIIRIGQWAGGSETTES